MKRLADVAKERREAFPEARRIKVADVMDKEITIEAVEFRTSNQFGEFAILKAKLGGETVSFTTYSKVVIDDLKAVQGDFPLLAKFRKPAGKDYYDIE